MSNRLTGKTAFVTAAGQGIGRATALAFVAQGARVIATDVNAAALESLHKECGCTVDVLDVTKADAVQAAAAKHGPVDVLFNGAGFVHAGSVLDCTEDEWEFAFSLNVRSQFRMIKAFLPGMLKKGNGSIINMASVAGSIKGAPSRFVYGATKAAVIGLTKSVAADFITQGVRCNAICPGWVLTPLVQKQVDARAEREGISNEVAKKALVSEKQPSGEFVAPEQLAALAIFLCGPDASEVRGVAWNMDGGWTAQ